MNIIEKIDDGNVLRIIVDSNEESLFSLLKTYLESESNVELVGSYKEHHLVDKVEFFLKVSSGNAVDVFNKALKRVKKDLESKKVK